MSERERKREWVQVDGWEGERERARTHAPEMLSTNSIPYAPYSRLSLSSSPTRTRGPPHATASCACSNDRRQHTPPSPLRLFEFPNRLPLLLLFTSWRSRVQLLMWDCRKDGNRARREPRCASSECRRPPPLDLSLINKTPSTSPAPAPGTGGRLQGSY